MPRSAYAADHTAVGGEFTTQNLRDSSSHTTFGPMYAAVKTKTVIVSGILRLVKANTLHAENTTVK